LAETTGETTTLEVLAGDAVMILDEVSSRHLLGIAQDVGMRLPLHATSTGKLLLAHLPETEAAGLQGAPLRALTAATVTSPATLRRQLGEIRAAGYAVTAGELELGFTAVAAPVRNASGRVVAAVSVGGPSSRLDGDTLVRVVDLTRRAGEQISRRLGFR
jgi:DNA-binding IclR family transcriptional regulator